MLSTNHLKQLGAIHNKRDIFSEVVRNEVVLAQNLVDDLLYTHSSKNMTLFMLFVSFLAKNVFLLKRGT